MDTTLPADLRALDEQFEAIDRDARAVIEGLTPEQGAWRPDAGSWSVAHCLDHLATANRVYLAAMRESAVPALQRERRRRGPAVPGFVGRWFVRTLEPPIRARFKMKAPRLIQPRSALLLDDAFAAFMASQKDVRAFLREYSGIDLTGVRFVNPFVRGVRFSLATGLHVIAAHDRRHLLQARAVRDAALRVPR